MSGSAAAEPRVQGWRRWLRLGALSLLVALTVRVGLHFPWARTGEALLHTNRLLLAAALVVNLVSLVAKGWGWHRLLRPNTNAGWMNVQRANLLGSAVGDVSVALVGEAARVRALAREEQLPMGLTAISVAAARLAEAVALGIVIAVAFLVFPLPSFLARAGLVAGALLATGAVVVVAVRRPPVAERLRRHLPSGMVDAVRTVGRRPFGEAVALALVNWVAQWATYALVLSATHVTTSPEAAFAALLAANLGGILRLTPANVGVFQASLVVGLAAFGVDSSSAILAGLVLQAVQVPPVIGLASLAAGVDGLSRLRKSADEGAGGEATRDEDAGDVPAAAARSGGAPAPRLTEVAEA